MVFIVDEVPKEEISIIEDGENVLTYNYGESSLHPFIHPIYAPNGIIATEGTRDTKQRHLPGLCFSFGTVKDNNGNPLPLKRSNTELDRKFINTAESSEIIKIISETTWTESEILLIETFHLSVKPVKNDLRILELDVVLQTKSKQIKFTDDIGLSYSAVEMEHRKTANANGRIGEAEVNKQDSDWATLCGIVANSAFGVAICPHPTNGVTQFLAEDTYEGYLSAKGSDFTLKSKETYSFRYRVLIYLGDLFTFDIGKYYSNYCM